MQSAVHSVRQAFRSLRRQPRLVSGVVILLALGIGSTTATFTLVNAALLAELPYPSPERVVRLATYDRVKEIESRVSYPDFEDWRAGSTSFEAIGAAGDARLTVADARGAESLIGQYVSDDYFRILGGSPVIGREFDSNETKVRGPVHALIIVSHGYWQRALGGDARVVGQRLTTTVGTFEIVGVMNPEFIGLLERADFWIPASASALVYPGWTANRTRRWNRVVARLRPAVTLDTARAELAGIAGQTASAFPASHANLGVRLGPLDESFRAAVRPGLLLLLCSALFLLAIACANAAHLMLVRVQGRRAEMAVRAALGSSRGRVIGLLLTESLILSLAGGVFGMFIGFLLFRGILGLQAIDLPRYVQPDMDMTVLAAAFALTLMTCVGFGLVPALTASRVDLRSDLRAGGGRGHSSTTSLLARLLVVGQVAVSLTLLIGAGLLSSSLARLERFDPGFRIDGLVAIEINPTGARYLSRESQREFARVLDERLNQLAGMDTAIVAPHLPPRLFWPLDVRVEGGADIDPTTRVEMHSVSPDFFEFLQIPVRSGRRFTSADSAMAPRTVLISESLARRLWPGQEPLGKRLRAGDSKDDGDWLSVVGVVGDVKYGGIRSARGPDFDLYFPLEQFPSSYMTVAVRSDRDPASVVAAVRRELFALDPSLPILAVSTVPERFSSQRSFALLQSILVGLFAFVAFVMAAGGLYSTISYSVSRRTREIGIRSALGASPGELISMVLREGSRLAVSGLVVGLLASRLLARMLRSLLFGVDPADPLTIVASILLLGGVALGACLVPARRATRVDTSVALGAD